MWVAALAAVIKLIYLGDTVTELLLKKTDNFEGDWASYERVCVCVCVQIMHMTVLHLKDWVVQSRVGQLSTQLVAAYLQVVAVEVHSLSDLELP